MKKFLKKIIPVRYHYLLSELKHSFMGSTPKSSYSQFGEDLVIAQILQGPHGLYVDVGAHHPERYSNTKLLHARGWKGINIDPNPDAIKLFNEARPRDVNLCVGVAVREGTLIYHRFSDPAVNTFDAQEAEKWKGKNWLAYLGSEEVKVAPLGAILAGSGVAIIDLLSVDAEGMDLEVLESNDWERYLPRVICVEGGEFNSEHPQDNRIFEYLTAKGYRLRETRGLSLIFDRI